MQNLIRRKTKRTGKKTKRRNPAKEKSSQVVLFRLQRVGLVSALG